jgi:hypothetical protein
MRFEIELDAEEPLSLPPEVVACIRGGTWILTLEPKPEYAGEQFRDHSAFLAGYAPEDDGLYDDV